MTSFGGKSAAGWGGGGGNLLGYSQVPEIDYFQTFSPTAKISSICVLLQLALGQNMEAHQMDVKTAYLNAPINCELYIEQPEGFVKYSETGEKLV